MRRWEPIKEIDFAAKFGFISKRIWLEFFATGSKSWRNKLWVALTARGYFEFHPADIFRQVLILSRSHPFVLQRCSGEPVRAPSIAQLAHDETLAVGVLKLLRAGIASSYQTDAELRRIEHERNSESKLPDLILEVGSKIIAVELELTQKSKDRYRKMAEAYSKRSHLSEVIFVIRSKAIMDSILREWAGTTANQAQLGFMKLPFWETDPVNSKIAFQKNYATLKSLYSSHTE